MYDIFSDWKICEVNKLRNYVFAKTSTYDFIQTINQAKVFDLDSLIAK